VTSEVRVGVIGVGHLGQHHARILATLPGVRFVGLVDADPVRAAEIGGRLGVRVFPDASSLAGLVDAVTVAAPTDVHVAVARPLLERGVAVLVEKPLTPDLASATALVGLAERSGAILAAGHTERFNPAIEAASAVIRDPRFIEVRRLSPFPERSLDIDVVFDLMIHDLDLLLALVGSPVTAVTALGRAVLTTMADFATARLTFASGCVANVTASRVSQERERSLRVVQADGFVTVDCAARTVDVVRVDRRGARPVLQSSRLPVAEQEPLRAELEDFVDAVRLRRAPRVSGQAGRDAIALATRVTDAIAGRESGDVDLSSLT